MKVKKGYLIRNVGNETVVVPTGEEAVNFNGMISLNNSGRLLFETLQKESTYEELVNVMTNHYNVSDKQVKSDIDNFLKVLRKHNILDET